MSSRLSSMFDCICLDSKINTIIQNVYLIYRGNVKSNYTKIKLFIRKKKKYQ